jgi:Right handed beta helix region
MLKMKRCWHLSYIASVSLMLALFVACGDSASQAQLVAAQCDLKLAARTERNFGGEGFNGYYMYEPGGKYCLTGDVSSTSFSFGGHTNYGAQTFINPKASNITLDLQGHTLYANTNAMYFIVGCWPEKKFDSRGNSIAGRPGIACEEEHTKGFHFQNGKISLKAAGMAINFTGIFGDIENLLSDAYGSQIIARSKGETEERRLYMEGIHKRTFEHGKKESPQSPADYPTRNITVEKMDIRTHAPSIQIQGGSTIIRNSTIETDSGTAISLFGPNAIIENNTIIVHSKQDTNRREADAPIRLQHGDGAIIRNNKFIFKDDAPKRALSLFDTGPITFENNTYYGLSEKDQAIKAWTGTVQVKESGTRYESIAKSLLLR